MGLCQSRFPRQLESFQNPQAGIRLRGASARQEPALQIAELAEAFPSDSIFKERLNF